MGVIQKIIRKLAKRGFTLVEALIATILVGSCIMPIVGTMQNAANMTQHMVDDSKLQMLARSRMNLETSRANNEQKNVDITTKYHYDYYKERNNESSKSSIESEDNPLSIWNKDIFKNSASKPESFKQFIEEYIIKAYEVNVEVRDDVTLLSGDAAEKEEKGFNGLKKVVVTAKLIGEDGSLYYDFTATGSKILPEWDREEKYVVEPPNGSIQKYSLVSLITVPAVSTEYIWALDKEGRKVLGLDPITGLTAVGYSLNTYYKTTKIGDTEKITKEEVDKPFTSILVKPDGKSLLLVGSVNVYTANWEYYCGNFCVDPTNERCGSFVSANNFEIPKSYSSYINTSCVVRPDGKKAYFTNGNNIYATTLDWDSKTNLCDSKKTITSTSGKKYSNLKVGNDGYLYYLEKDSATDANSYICRVSMYSNGIGKSAEISKLIDYALSPDGLRVYALTCNNESNKTSQGYSLKVYDSKALNEISSEKVEFKNEYSKVNCSNIACSADSKYIIMYDKGYVEGVTVQKAKAYFYEIGSNTVNLNNFGDKKIKYIEFSDSPKDGSSKKLIYAPVTNALAVDCNNNRLNLIDFAEFKNNVLATSTGKENNVVTTTEINAKTLTDISARNPEFLYVAVNEGTEAKPKYKVKTLDVASGSYMEDLEYDFNEKPINLILTPVGDRLLVVTEPATGETGRRLYVVDLIRNEINEPKKAAYGDNYFFLNQKTPSNEPIICFYGSGGSQFYKLKYDNSLTLIGDNSNSVKILQLSDGKLLWYDTNGLTLYEKPTVTDTNLTLGSKIVTYNGENFPPSDITDMAISPDDRVLALKCGNKVKFYDFKTYDFKEKTKIDGKAIIDVRNKSYDLKLTSVPSNKAEYSMLKNDSLHKSLESKIFTDSFEQSDLAFDRRIFGYTSYGSQYKMTPVNNRPIRSYYDLVLRNYDYFFHTGAGRIKSLQVDMAGEGKVEVEKFAAAMDKAAEPTKEILRNRKWNSLQSKLRGSEPVYGYTLVKRYKRILGVNVPYYTYSKTISYYNYGIFTSIHSDTIKTGIRLMPSDTTKDDWHANTVDKSVFTYHCWLMPYNGVAPWWWTVGHRFMGRSYDSYLSYLDNRRKNKSMEFVHSVGSAGTNTYVHVDLYFYASSPVIYNDSVLGNTTCENLRTMAIEIEGNCVKKDFNAYKEGDSNLYVPIVMSYDTIVTDGELNIKFRNMTNRENAMISAIKLTYWQKSGEVTDNSKRGGLYATSGTSNPTVSFPFIFEPAFMCEYKCSSLEDNRLEFNGDTVLTNHAQNWSSPQKYIKETFYPLDSIANNASETLNKQIFLSESPYSDDYITFDFNDKNYKRKDGKKIASCTETILKSASRTVQNIHINSSSSVAEVADLNPLVVNCNRAVVASGGIYLVDQSNNDIYVFNPIKDFNKTVSGSTVKTIIKNTGKNFGTGGSSGCNAPIAVYDNKIYGFSYDSKNVYKYDIVKNIATGSVAAHTQTVTVADKLDLSTKGKIDLSPRFIGDYATTDEHDSEDNIGVNIFEVFEEYDGTNYEYHPACEVTWNPGKNYPDGSDFAYKAFDNDDNTKYKIGGIKNSVRRYIQIEYKEAVKITEIALFKKDGHIPSCIKIIGGDSEESLTPLLTGTGSDNSYPIYNYSFVNGEFKRSFDNNSYYKIYRIEFFSDGDPLGSDAICIKELKLYGYTNHVIKNVPEYNINIPESGMTTVMNDNLSPVNVSNGAVCSTPYGIMLAGGGGTNGSKEALLYWPHAVADYDAVSQTQREGIFRSLPDMKNGDKDVYMKNCSMCWHKGKAYVFGDGTYNNTLKCSLMIYDPETNSWSVGADIGADIDRRKAAVVSFGDYIYIIGGETLTGSNYPKITRYTPDGSKADICDLPDNLAKNISAVAYGSSIYLIGGQKSDGNPSNKIYRFTP